MKQFETRAMSESKPFTILQLLAYGGSLKYSVAFYSSDGFGAFNLEPQVLLKGGRTRKQVIYVDVPAPENGVRQEQEVGMKEVRLSAFPRAPSRCGVSSGRRQYERDDPGIRIPVGLLARFVKAIHIPYTRLMYPWCKLHLKSFLVVPKSPSVWR